MCDLERIDGFGCSSLIYLDKENEKVVKVYKDSRGLDFRISKEVAEFLKNYKNDCFININDYEVDRSGIVTSYTYDYIHEVERRIVDLSPEYIIASLRYLDEIAVDLANEGISISDNHAGNILTSPDGLIIIDPDRYEYDQYFKSVKDLKIYNKSMMLGYIKNKISYECGLRSDLYEPYIIRQFNMDLSDTTDLSSEVSKRIRGKKLRGLL